MEKRIVINNLMFRDYTVNELGEIFSNKFDRKIKLRHNTVKGGYHIVRLYNGGEKFDLLVARIVASVFILNPKNKPQVNHIDGNKDNNSASNLQWVTQSENIKHAYCNKLMQKTYKDCWNALLHEKQVLEIRKLFLSKIKQREIAVMFNVSEQVISSIKHNRSYKGVGLIKKGLAIDVNTLQS